MGIIQVSISTTESTASSTAAFDHINVTLFLNSTNAQQGSPVKCTTTDNVNFSAEFSNAEASTGYVITAQSFDANGNAIGNPTSTIPFTTPASSSGGGTPTPPATISFPQPNGINVAYSGF